MGLSQSRTPLLRVLLVHFIMVVVLVWWIPIIWRRRGPTATSAGRPVVRRRRPVVRRDLAIGSRWPMMMRGRGRTIRNEFPVAVFFWWS